jgi:hypothetical protein
VPPFIVRDSYWATTCDNYLVTENGPSACLHKTPKKIIEI